MNGHAVHRPTTGYRPLGAPRRPDQLPASFIQRGGALLFDSFVFFVTVPVPVQAFLVLTGRSRVACRWTGGGEECVLDPDDARLSRILFWTLMVVFVVVFSWFLSRRRTAGQMATGMRVVDRDTLGQVPFGRAVLRTTAMAISALPLGLGFWWALWDPRGRTWHDVIARTRAISP